jgi:hypothetical protein
MSNDPTDARRQKINEFMQLLPLTLAIAGLPDSERGHNYNEGQMEVRSNTIRTAFKMARQLLLDVSSK